LYKSHQNYQE